MSIFESNYLIGYVDRKWAEILSIYYDSLVSVFMIDKRMSLYDSGEL